jgi:hypothetical protein
MTPHKSLPPGAFPGTSAPLFIACQGPRVRSPCSCSKPFLKMKTRQVRLSNATRAMCPCPPTERRILSETGLIDADVVDRLTTPAEAMRRGDARARESCVEARLAPAAGEDAWRISSPPANFQTPASYGRDIGCLVLALERLVDILEARNGAPNGEENNHDTRSLAWREPGG